MANPDVTIRTVDCCAACEHSRGFESVEWCVMHRKVVRGYHLCGDIERSPYLYDCDSLQSELSEVRPSLKRWHGIDLLWTMDEIKQELTWLWLVPESENDLEPPSETTVALTADLLLSVIDILKMGHVSSSGGGDARVEWHTQDKLVTLCMSPTKSYIYHQHGAVNGSADPTSENLRQWLTWLWSEDND